MTASDDLRNLPALVESVAVPAADLLDSQTLALASKDAQIEGLKEDLDTAAGTIADLEAENAALKAKLAECEEPTPEPTPITTLWGMGSFRVLASNTASELDPYRGKTPPQVYALLDAEFLALGGKRMQCVRSYDGGLPATFNDHDAADFPMSAASVASLKGDDTQMASGGLDARLRAFVQSCPTDHTVYLIWNHERDNDTDALANPTAVMGVHRRALARFAQVVIQSRESRKVIPACCPTGWNLQDQNTSYPRDVLNPAAELTGAGVALDQFVFLVDSYYRKPPTAAAVTTVHEPIVKRVKGWGFDRVGFGEVGVDSYPSANRSPAAAYIEAWQTMAEAYSLELVCWYESGGGDKAPAQGWWIYGSQAKQAWADAVAG